MRTIQMKLSTAISTQQINALLDLNQEIRQKLSSMPYYTEQEMKSLEQWLVEVERLGRNLENLSYIICHHSQILRKEFQKQQKEDTSKGLTEESSKSGQN